MPAMGAITSSGRRWKRASFYSSAFMAARALKDWPTVGRGTRSTIFHSCSMCRPDADTAAARVGSHPHVPEENAVEPSELELYTSHELIAELMRRKTFLGVIVHP